MEALVLYLTFHYFLSTMLSQWGPFFGVDFSAEVGGTSGLAMIANIKTLDMGMIGALAVSGLVISLHNKFFDTEQPWLTRNTDKTACDNTLYQCVQIIASLAVLLLPFLPFSSEKVLHWLNISGKWERRTIPAGHSLPEVELLFQRIDKKVIDIETEKVKSVING